MDHHTFFLHLLIILLSARIFAEIATRLHMPRVMGELFAGVLLGPSLLGWIEPQAVIKLLAEIGIILLLFEVGLGTDVKRLVRTGKEAIIVAMTGFVLPFTLGFALAYGMFRLPILESLFIGGTLTATSIGITMRILMDLTRHNEREGQIILGAAVLDDVLGIVLLALLYEFSIGGGINLINASKVLLFVVTFFVLAPIAAKFISILIKHFDQTTKVSGLIPTSVVSLVLFFAWLAHAVGAPELLGGFAAGLALSRRFFLPFGIAFHGEPAFAHRIEEQMKPIIFLFTPIFFVMVGLSLNLRVIDWHSPFIWTFSSCLFVVAIVGKLGGALVIQEPWRDRVIVGLAMIPRGEVGLIFAELGRVSEIFSNETYAGMVIVIALTTVFPPLIIKWMYQSFGHPLPISTSTKGEK